MTTERVEVELDDYARELLDDYRRAHDAAQEWDALRIKARDQLFSWFFARGADVGLIHGRHVVTYVDSESPVLDTERLRAEEPAVFAAYKTKMRRNQQLRLVGGGQ